MNTIVNEIHGVSPEVESDVDIAKKLSIQSIEKLKELRKLRRNAKEMLDSIYGNHDERREAAEQLRQAKERIKAVDARLSQNADVFSLKEKIKDINEEYAETKNRLSDYLIVFETKSGQMTFIDPSSDSTVQIVKTAKPVIIKKKQGR